MPTILTDIPNLPPGEVPFRLDDGTLVTVRIEQLPSPDGHHLPLVVSGRKITPDGADVAEKTPFHPAPHPVRLPESVHSVQLAALGATTLSEVMARETAAALNRWPSFLLGLASLQHIPVRNSA